MYNINYGLILSCIICYLFGSIPNGYFLVKMKCSKDITREGSGNVGTLNAFEVSNSKLIGVIVLALDFLKGFIPVLIMLYVFKFDLYFIYISSLFILVGHNYPLWLKFKGGRGLASAAGIFILLNFGFLITWLLMWRISYAFKRDVLVSNVVATFSLPFLVVVLKKLYLFTMNSHLNQDYYNLFVLFTVIVSVLIIIKHKLILSKIMPFTARNL